jgi:hypothetical protein
MEASISALVMSIGSSAAMSLGLAPNPETGTSHKNIELAKFNIDLLRILKEKTQNNLSEEESSLLAKMLTDLQMQFIEAQKN